MKRLAKALGLCCVLLAATAMSPTNKYLRIKEDSKDGLVVLSVTHRMQMLYWNYRPAGDERVSSFRTDAVLRGDELVDGPAVIVPMVLPAGEYELVYFTAMSRYPLPPVVGFRGDANPCWNPAGFFSVRFRSVAGKATYLGNLDLAADATHQGGTYEISVTERSSTFELVRKHYGQLKPEQWQTALMEPGKHQQGALAYRCKGTASMRVPVEIP